MRLCAISVDLDEIPNYFHIHGLPAPSERASTAVYDVAVDRLLALSKGAAIPLTLFAVGADLVRPQAAEKLARARAMGAEIGNHSHSHLYDLTRRDRATMRREVERGIEEIARAVGERPVGFRAPGYTMSDELVSVLEELEVGYDSSVFPCPAYFAAKTAAIAAIHLARRRSHSVVDTPKVLLAPTRPYHMGRPYWRRGRGLLELPIQVTRGLRLPFIGTSVVLAGPSRARSLAKMCVGEPLVNLELHGIDVLNVADAPSDDTGPGLDVLRRHQPDLRVDHDRKLAALFAVIEVLRDAGYAFVTLREAASRFH